MRLTTKYLDTHVHQRSPTGSREIGIFGRGHWVPDQPNRQAGLECPHMH